VCIKNLKSCTITLYSSPKVISLTIFHVGLTDVLCNTDRQCRLLDIPYEGVARASVEFPRFAKNTNWKWKVQYKTKGAGSFRLLRKVRMKVLPYVEKLSVKITTYGAAKEMRFRIRKRHDVIRTMVDFILRLSPSYSKNIAEHI
jgi:hypothetical protein